MATTTSTTQPRHRWFKRTLIAGVAILLALVVAFAIFVRWAQPDTPSAFYDPPADLPDGPPGTIIRDDQIDGAGPGDVTRILYTSTDPEGVPIAVSGVVATPPGEPPPGGWPVIAWAHGTTGVDRRCAPSIDYPDGGLSRVPEYDELIAAGAVVVFTDYPGLGTPGPHPYLVGESEGRAVLDSIRAAHLLLDDRVADTAAIYGHSQGGHAAAWADQIASTYAPELEIAGVAAMAPPSNLGELLDADKSELAGIVLTALALASWSDYYPDADLDEIVGPVAEPVVRDVGTKCIGTTDQGLTLLPDVAVLESTFLSEDPTDVPSWNTHLEANSLGDVSLSVPLLVAQGLTDTIVRPDVTAAWVQRQCAAGATIEYQTYPDTGHFQIRVAAADTVKDWLLARVSGAAAPTGCTDSTGPRAPDG